MTKQHLLIVTFVFFFVNVKSQSLTLRSHLSYSTTCSGIWHYVDSLNNEYALIGVYDNISIVDVTDPDNPIERFSIPALPGQESTWREIKTWGKYAYSVSEGGGGVVCIDLTQLPDTITYVRWYGDGVMSGQIDGAHTIAADNGYIYLFGGYGSIIVDVSNPMSPHFTSVTMINYMHDGYVRNDTLWGAEIYAGQFSVTDISNKYNPVLLTTQPTPGAFCHSVWLNDAGTHLFTVDEMSNTPLGSFNITDIGDIELEETFYNDSLPHLEIHNVRVFNDYLINPSYGGHLTIADAARPDNIIEIANAPTNFGTSAFLCWDADPFLPSGNIVVSDLSGGLSVFTPTYQRACYLEGSIIDSLTSLPIHNANIEIIAAEKSTTSNLLGIYKTGVKSSGVYTVTYSRPGYISQTFSGVALSNGLLTTINVKLKPYFQPGSVTYSLTGNGLSGITVVASDSVNTYSTTSDANGNFIFSGIIPGTYTITAAQWGYLTQCISLYIDGSGNIPAYFSLSRGYQDDFSTNNNWIVSGNCVRGSFEREVPVFIGGNAGLAANPGEDVSTDCSNLCFVTGNGPYNAGATNVDSGYTSIISPPFDLSVFTDPYINYSRWYYNPPNLPFNKIDTLKVFLSDGTTTVMIDEASLDNTPPGTWADVSIRVSDFITPGTGMKLSVSINDNYLTNNICEAAFDNFFVSGQLNIQEGHSGNNITVYPNPFTNSFVIKLNPDLVTPSTALQLFDVTGRIAYEQKISFGETTVDMPSSISSGFYTLHLISTNYSIDNVSLVKY